MADFLSSTCNSALRAAPVRPPDTGDTAGRLRGPWGGRERAPGVPAALATAWDRFHWYSCSVKCTRVSCTALGIRVTKRDERM